MAKVDLNKKIEEVMELAKESGISENFFFITTFNDYKRQRIILARIGSEIDKQGAVIDGKANSLIADYNKTAQSAAKVAESLLKMVMASGVETKKEHEEKKNVCPRFEELSPNDIKKWCKKFDIDPSDYSKKFLYRALEKRWNFEYGE